MYKIVRLEMQNTLCQWVEIYKNDKYLSRILVGKDQNDDDIVREYYNGLHISAMF